MLTPEEVTKLNHLIDGSRLPEDGMERHFLRVISGEAMPCSPMEQEWYDNWQKRRPLNLEEYQSKYEVAATLLREREETILNLEEHIKELERELRQLGILLEYKDQSIKSLTKEISRLEDWLKNSHETLKKYEQIKMIQEHVKDNDEINGNSMDKYSTNGEDWREQP